MFFRRYIITRLSSHETINLLLLLFGFGFRRRLGSPVAAISLFGRETSSPGRLNTRSMSPYGRQTGLRAKEQNGDDDASFQVQTRNPFRLMVLRLGVTEPRAISPFNYGKYDGLFTCAYCGNILFDSNAKFSSGSGWPSFWRTYSEDSVKYKRELDGRLECQCARCSRYIPKENREKQLPHVG